MGVGAMKANPKSEIRNPIRLFAFLCVLCAFALNLPAVETLQFDASSTPSCTYRFYFGVAAGGNNVSLPIGTNTVVALTNGPWGTYYTRAVSVVPDTVLGGANVIESAPSNEIRITNRPAAPLQLRIVPVSYRIEGTIDGGAKWTLLAEFTNGPALLHMQRAQLLRASVKYPPLP